MKPIYARLFCMPGIIEQMPPVPVGYTARHTGVEFWGLSGGVSKRDEPLVDFLDRVARRLQIMFFVYAEGPDGKWLSVTWNPQSGWDEWEECVEPEPYPDTTEEE